MKQLLHSLRVTGLRLKCPVCEQGDLFAGYFKMNKTCPHCGVRFERETGEETGGMSVSIVLLGIIFLIVYPLTEVLTDWSVEVHLAIWLPFSILFPIVFYRYSRSLWVVFLYLTGSIRKEITPIPQTDVSIVDAFHYQPDKSTPPTPKSQK